MDADCKADLLFVDRPVDHFVFGASRWEAEAPCVLPYRVRFLLGHFHRYLVPER